MGREAIWIRITETQFLDDSSNDSFEITLNLFSTDYYLLQWYTILCRFFKKRSGLPSLLSLDFVVFEKSDPKSWSLIFISFSAWVMHTNIVIILLANINTIYVTWINQ